MQVTTNQAKKVMDGDYTFSQLGFSLLLARLKFLYEKETTAASLKKCTDEINNFLEKYQMIMANDYAVISKL